MTPNALLRRVDWRFLAGMPEPQRAYCPRSGRLRNAVRAVAGRLVDEPAPGECDLVVSRSAGGRRLNRACAALAPGGALYVERWRPIPGGAATVRKRLHAAGLEQIACYWPWPPPHRETPVVWLPIDAPEAIRWYLDSRPRPTGWLARGAAAARRWLWRSLWRLGLLAPICAVARKPLRSEEAGSAVEAEQSSTADSGGSLPVILAAQRRSWGLADSEEDPACLLITAGRSPRNKLVALAFNSGRSEPQIAVKLPRVQEAEAGLEREASVLDAVHAEREQPGIPRLIARATIAERIALAETVVTGRPLLDLLRPETHRRLCLNATDLLADLATEAPQRHSTDWRQDIAEDAVQALSEPERQLASALLARLGPLPEVVEQRDCSPWNVLVQRDGTLALLDWESAAERGLPGLDLLYFLTYAALFVEETMHTGRELDSYRRVLTPTTPTGGVYAECTAAYAERVGFDHSAFEPLRLLCWLVHARSAQLRTSTQTMGAPNDGSLFLELARHELIRHEA